MLGWEDVAGQLQRQAVDPIPAERLRRQITRTKQEAPGIIRQAYGIVVTVNEGNQIHAFKLPASGNPLFEEIKGHRKARIADTPVNAEALAPDGPYDLWREGEESRFANQLAESFARYPHLPKVLRPKLVTDTVLAGVRQGLFVAQLTRPDGSSRTWWREPVDPVAVEDTALELLLPETGRLASLNPGLLAPGDLPDLWKPTADDGSQRVGVATLLEYFSGNHVATIPHEGYEEQAGIPACDPDLVLDAVGAAVERGVVWLTNPPATFWKEAVPAGTLNPAAELLPPPDRVEPRHLTEETVPTAWSGNRTNGLALTQALCQKRSSPVPWGVVREGIGDAVQTRWLGLVKDSGPIACTLRPGRSSCPREAQSGAEAPADNQTGSGQAGRWAGSGPGGPRTGPARVGRRGGAAIRGVGECHRRTSG